MYWSKIWRKWALGAVAAALTAALYGCSRETVNKTLAEFARHGWVRTAGASYVITDEEALRERAAT